MPVPVIMPKLEMSQETAVIVDWLKQDGDFVKKGEPIMTVETDKVTVDIESTGEGILREISAKAGDTVPVTTVVAYLYQTDEKPAHSCCVSESCSSKANARTFFCFTIVYTSCHASGSPYGCCRGCGTLPR